MLKATIRCSCGCKYELLSTSNHEIVKCPNCSETFIESEKLISILKAYDSMKFELPASCDFLVEEEKLYSNHKLQLVTTSDFEILQSV